MSHITLQPRAKQTRNIVESIILGIILTGLSYAIGIFAHWLTFDSLNWLEVLAVFTNYSCVYLCVKERRINYPIGALACAAYVVLFAQSGLFSSAILNAYMVPTLVYGWIRWRKDSNTRPVHHIRPRLLPAYVLITGLGYGGAALISQHFGGALAWTDATILAGTILAQFLLDNKVLENWFVWGIVNVFAIYTYATTGLPLVALQYVFFLANAIYGYIIWKRSMNYGKSLRSDDGDAADQWTLATDSIR